MLAGIPIDGLACLIDPRGRDRSGALGRIDGPGVGAIFVASVDLAFEDVAFAAGWEEVPAEAAIADAALEQHHGSCDGVAERMADAVFRPHRLAADLQELVVEELHAAAAADHHPHIPHVGPFGPVARGVDEVRVFLLVLHREVQRAIGSGDLTETDHVGLAEQDEDLHRFGEVGPLGFGRVSGEELRARQAGDGQGAEREE